MEAHSILVKRGALVDASLIDTPLKPKGKPNYAIPVAREAAASSCKLAKEATSQRVAKQVSAGVDTDGAWIKKAGKIRYGYKKHQVTDEEGLVFGVVTTAVNLNEVSNLADVLASADLPEGLPLKADKGYQSKKNAALLAKRKLQHPMLKKAKKGQRLTKWERRFNQLIGKTRFKVARIFGSIKRWFGGVIARYRGIEKMPTQHLMEALGYNLYRSPGGIVASTGKNEDN